MKDCSTCQHQICNIACDNCYDEEADIYVNYNEEIIPYNKGL